MCHARLRENERICADIDVAADACLSGCGHAFAELRRTCDAHLTAQGAMFSDGDVVADLHEIVDLRAAADDGGSRHGAIDASTRTDLDAIADHDVADLR